MIIHLLAGQAAASAKPAVPAKWHARHKRPALRHRRRPSLWPGIGLALAVLLAVPGAPAVGRPLLGIIGQDDRVPLDSQSWPWQALGRVNQAGGGHCTGTLIAADAVLTAAHCLMDRASGLWLAAREVVFVAGYRRDEDLGFARGRDILRPQGSVDPRHPALEDIPNDWAVLYLDHPLPVRPVPLRPLPLAMGSGAHLMRAGYSQDRPHLLSLHDGCALLDRLDNDQVLVTDCDGTRGDSGSPLLLKQGKGVWIVGVTSAVAARGKPGSYAVHAAVFAGQIGKVK